MRGRVRIEGELKCMICQEINICGSVHVFVSVCKCVCVCVWGGGTVLWMIVCVCVYTLQTEWMSQSGLEIRMVQL